MNIETANRLYQYRKQMGLSQEELAAKIGVSRQAVSKWERAEASPDTDNLIELAKIYGLTLDELLKGKEDEAPAQEAQAAAEDDPAPAQEDDDTGFTVDDSGDHVHIGRGGIHITDRDGTRVDIDRHGVFVNEKGEQKVYTDADGHIHKCTHDCDHRDSHTFWLSACYPMLTVIAYILFGFFNICGGWGYGWIIFLTIPVYYSLIESFKKRNPTHFAYPVLATIAFLIMGFAGGLWHPGWVVFLTVPVYYAIAGSAHGRSKSHKD